MCFDFLKAIFDDKSPFITSGIRVGTAAITTRGMKETDMAETVDFIDAVLSNHENEAKLKEVKSAINEWMTNFQLYS